VKYFTYLRDLIKMMQDVPVKINPGFPWQKWRSSRRKFKEESNETLYFWSTAVYGAGEG
jgi:hypothetical protein